MDALEFLRERKRMCNSYGHCKGCPLERGFCNFGSNTPDEVCERIIAAVEHWSKGHPRKTRQSVFLEQWPNASVNEDGILFCPKTVNSAHTCYCKDREGCPDCRREFWSQEVE